MQPAAPPAAVSAAQHAMNAAMKQSHVSSSAGVGKQITQMPSSAPPLHQHMGGKPQPQQRPMNTMMHQSQPGLAQTMPQQPSGAQVCCLKLPVYGGARLFFTLTISYGCVRWNSCYAVFLQHPQTE